MPMFWQQGTARVADFAHLKQLTIKMVNRPVSILLNGPPLTSKNYNSMIWYHINGYHLCQYMQKKNGWTDSSWTLIDFGIFGQHFKRLWPKHQVTHTKRTHGQLPLITRRYQQSREKDPILAKCIPRRQTIFSNVHQIRYSSLVSSNNCGRRHQKGDCIPF